MVPSLHGKYRGKQWKVTEFLFLGSKITANGDCSHEIKRRLLPGRKIMTNLETITLYLAADNKLYYYIVDHKEDFGKPEFLKETTWGKEGIREVLRNHRHAPAKVLMDAKKQLDNWFNALPKSQQEANDSIYNRAMIMIKKGHVDIVNNDQLDKARYDKVDKDMRDYTESNMVPTLAVNIKPLDNSNYDNLVTILDEMQICCIGKYVIDKINEKDIPILTENGISLE